MPGVWLCNTCSSSFPRHALSLCASYSFGAGDMALSFELKYIFLMNLWWECSTLTAQVAGPGVQGSLAACWIIFGVGECSACALHVMMRTPSEACHTTE
jgi:hypothetical protein